jgi:hypothetical protein
MDMTVLKARPVNVQVKHRGSFAPPRYDLFRTEVSASLAMKFAEIFNLRSTGIIVNQNASSTHYLSFRYFLTGEPFRFFDASIGIDQVEIGFSNPASIPELIDQIGTVWRLVFESLAPLVVDNYFEASLHCETKGVSTSTFLDKIVTIQRDTPAGIQKGFSLTNKTSETVSKINLEVSESIPEGLYASFAYRNRETMVDMASLAKLFENALMSYRSLQAIAQVDLMERS